MRLALALVALLVGQASADVKPRAEEDTPKAKADVKPHKKQRVKPGTPMPAPARTEYVTTELDRPEPRTQHKEGEYGGVEPGVASTTTGKHKVPPKNTLNWIGFEAKGGGATVFFQAAGAFEVMQHVEGSTLVAMLSLSRLGANTWRQVDTRFFETTLSGVVAKAVSSHGATKTAAHGSGIEVRFAFKTAADAKEAAMRTATEADGQYYVYLTFPPGSGSAMMPATTTPTKKPDTEK